MAVGGVRGQLLSRGWTKSRANQSLGRFPDLQEKYREFLPDLMVLADPELSFRSVSEAVAMASL
jgi:hypothetical protein